MLEKPGFYIPIAIAELLALPPDDPQRLRVLQLLISWRVTTLEITEAMDEEEQAFMANLSQAYVEWERLTTAKGLEQGLQQGLQQGATQEAKSLILRQLTRRVGELPELLRSQVEALELPALEDLGEALLDFRTIDDLTNWLQGNHAVG